MISYERKQEFLKEIEMLENIVQFAIINGENLEQYLAQIQDLKQQIRVQKDITLENQIQNEPRLDTNSDLEEKCLEYN